MMSAVDAWYLARLVGLGVLVGAALGAIGVVYFERMVEQRRIREGRGEG